MNRALRTLLDGFRIRRRRGLREWLEAEMTVPEGALQGQRYRCDSRPWVAALIPYLEQHRQIWLAAVPRTGKSLLGAGIGGYHADEFRESVQIVGPEERITIGFYQDKIERAFTANPRLRSLFPAKYGAAKRPDDDIRLTNGAVLRLRFNPKSIRSYDASCLICTEASMMKETSDETDTLTLAQRRQDDHRGGYQFFESTMTRAGNRFAREIKAGTDSRLHCACPGCGEYFEAGARGEADEEGGGIKRWYVQGWDVENRGNVDAYICCPHCERKITDADRPGMLKAIRVVHTNPSAHAFSVTVNWFHTKWTVQDVGLAEWDLKRQWNLENLRNLMQNLYCLPVSGNDEVAPGDGAREITMEVLTARARTNYRKGDVPGGIAHIVGSIDVQKSWLYWQVLGAGERGNYLINYGVTEIVPKALQKQVQPTEEMVTGALQESYDMLMAYNPAGVGLDVSYKHEASERPIVKKWANQFDNIYQIAGREHYQQQRMTKDARRLPAEVRDYFKCFRQEVGHPLYFLDVDKLKDIVLARMLYSLDAEGRFFFPSDTVQINNSWIFRHFMAERPVIKKTRYGQLQATWEKKPGVTRNDQWDLLIYNYALMQLLISRANCGGGDIDTDGAAALGLV